MTTAFTPCLSSDPSEFKPCPNCHGEGWEPKPPTRKCKVCKGKGRLSEAPDKAPLLHAEHDPNEAHKASHEPCNAGQEAYEETGAGVEASEGREINIPALADDQGVRIEAGRRVVTPRADSSPLRFPPISVEPVLSAGTSMPSGHRRIFP